MIDCYAEALALAEEARVLRRKLHQIPEHSFAEYKTCAFIRERLSELNIPFEAAGETGTVAVIKGESPKPVIALRADIDGLEITEKNDSEYRSLHGGFMHACGHDAHMAALLCAGKIISAHKDRFLGIVKLIFQQAEETGKGAREIIKSGLVNDVDAFFGIHNQPELPVGKIGLKSGPVMAGSNMLAITIIGKGGHGGYPHQTVDAIAVGAELIEGLQHIVSRELAPSENCVISICQFHAGNRDNIIAGNAKLSGTVRVTSDEARERIAGAILRICKSIAEAHRAQTEVSCEFSTPVLVNSDILYTLAVNAANRFLNDSPINFIPQMGTEDFSRYSEIAPVFFAFVGSGGKYPLHHECFDIDEKEIPIAAALFTAFVEEAVFSNLW
jgi:amidohydrolase